MELALGLLALISEESANNAVAAFIAILIFICLAVALFTIRGCLLFIVLIIGLMMLAVLSIQQESKDDEIDRPKIERDR